MHSHIVLKYMAHIHKTLSIFSFKGCSNHGLNFLTLAGRTLRLEENPRAPLLSCLLPFDKAVGGPQYKLHLTLVKAADSIGVSVNNTQLL